MVQHLGLVGVFQPVADHGDGVQRGFGIGRSGGGGNWVSGVGGQGGKLGEQQGGAEGTHGKAESGLQDEDS
ncbi:hypothetical protein D3C72_1994450 [compost metagenome]